MVGHCPFWNNKSISIIQNFPSSFMHRNYFQWSRILFTKQSIIFARKNSVLLLNNIDNENWAESARICRAQEFSLFSKWVHNLYWIAVRVHVLLFDQNEEIKTRKHVLFGSLRKKMPVKQVAEETRKKNNHVTSKWQEY